MMLQLKVIWHLLNLCAIGFAWAVQGSSGFSVFASKDPFSAFPPVEEQNHGYIPSASPFVNGSTALPPLTSHPLESSPPGPENVQPVPPQLPNTTTVSPTQSAVAPSTEPPSHDSPSQQSAASPELLSSLPPEVPLHDLAPQKPTATSPHTSVPLPPVTPPHVFASPPLASQPTSATTPSPPAISPFMSILSPPVLPLHSSVAPPPLPSGYASPPSIVAMPSRDKTPHHLASPSPLLEVMPSSVPSQDFSSSPTFPPINQVSSHSSAPPPQPIPSDVTVPPHPSATPPITMSSHALVPPPTYMPNVSDPPPNSTISNHPSVQSPLPAPTVASNPPPDLAPPPNSPYVSAPPPNATISEHSSAPLPPTPPIHASNSPPHVMPPLASSPPPPDAAPSHDVASSPSAKSHFSAPPPITLPIHASNPPPDSVPPILSLPPPDAAPSHNLAPSPPAESHFSASPPSSKHYFSTPPTGSLTSNNASYPPSASVSSHASAPSTTAEPPPSVHTLPSGSLPPVASNSSAPLAAPPVRSPSINPVLPKESPSIPSAPLAAPPVRSPSINPVLPRESPSIPPEAQFPHVSSPAPSIDQRGDRIPVPVAPSGPTYPLSPTNDHPEQGFSPSIAPSIHTSRGLPSLAPVATISPPISPTTEVAHSPSFSPLPSTNKTQHPSDSSHSAPETSDTVPSPAPKQQGKVESPRSLLAPAPENTQRYHPPTSHNPGSLEAMAPSQSPLTEDYISPVPTSVVPVTSGHSMTPFLSPKISPSGSSTREPNIELAPPILALPPPPPNQDCLSYTCLEPYTNTITGSPCGCVLPMNVELRIGVALYTFFPLVPELAREIATGIFTKQSQVRIMGANAASEQPDKTLLLIDLVPLGEKFDNITAFLIFERFWNKQVAISKSLFGDYEVLYVQYPGLPASPPMAPSDIAAINGGSEDNGSKIHPLGVDITKQGRKHRLSGSLIAIIVFSSVGAVLLCLLLGWILLFRHRRHSNQSAETPHVYPASIARSTGPTGQSAGSRPSFSLSFESSVAAYTGSAKTFTAGEIEKATDNFNPSRVLGEGGFGLVYSATIEDGSEVAVKVLKREDQQGGREFLAEIEMLSRLHHRNLVKLIGICAEEHIRCLIYELIPNGSVESHLHGIDKQTSPLDWATRMKIALGAARGLAYLHEDSSPRVIHRDFKASNILLEADFTPKVSDFGLARTAMDEENMHISTRVMGTFGYVAPEYAMTGHLLVKSDVYSYGVVLLELLTGRKPVDMTQPAGQENLVAWTRPYLTTKEALRSIVDPNLGPDISSDSVAKVAAIASMCVQPEVSHRPFMGEVVQALKLVCNDDTKDELGNESPRSENGSHEDVEKALSASSDVFSGTDACKESFRRHSSSGPIGGGRSWRFWKRGGTTSSREDVVGENGVYRFWSGSH